MRDYARRMRNGMRDALLIVLWVFGNSAQTIGVQPIAPQNSVAVPASRIDQHIETTVVVRDGMRDGMRDAHISTILECGSDGLP
jgi:hypothetical protein